MAYSANIEDLWCKSVYRTKFKPLAKFKQMKKLLHILILISCISCQNRTERIDQKVTEKYQEDYWRQLAYLVQLKHDVAQRSWKDFSKNDFFQPIVYYTHEGTFVLNPNEHIRNITEYKEMKPFLNAERIALSEKFTDTTNFNFNVSYSDSDSSALYYQENVLFFQSFDLTKKLIGINDLQDWSIMVIHELFHGYQRSIPEFKAYYTKLDIPGGPDEFLAKYHRDLDWYKKSVHEENELLKSIWINRADLYVNLIKYDSLRTSRIEKIKEIYGVDIREVEDYEIMIEGHARYFESLCKRLLAKGDSDTSMLSEEELPFITKLFDSYEITKDKGLYDIYNDRYYYQLGYNISMILEKYLPEYRETIYTQEFNFNRYLEKAHNKE
jgi:hypothetical protein